MRIIVAVLALAMALANVAHAFDPNAACVYVDNVEWKHWGGAPYGPTAEEALTDPKLDWYLKCSTAIPEPLKVKVKEAIRANPKGEQTAYLTPDMTLLEMASGPGRSHRTQHIMRNVKVARIVKALGVVLAAETPTWSVKRADGATLVIGDPFRCGNLSVIRVIPAPLPAVPAPPAKKSVPVVADDCHPPDGKYLFNVHAWKALPPGSLHDEAEKLIAAAKLRNSEHATRAAAYEPDDVSKTMGYRLRMGGGQHSSTTWAVVVLLRNPKTLVIEENLGILYLVGGVGSLVLSEAQHRKLIEVTMWSSYFDSPGPSGGEQRLWTFPWEWKTYRCMNVHGLEKP